MMSLVEHAKQELELLGVEDDMKDHILKVVEAFAEFGHSGGSASWAIPVLNDLLQFKNLTPLTDNPMEWMQVGTDMWQNVRRSEAFSSDGGKHYWLLSEGGTQVRQEPLHKAQPFER
jgi:hypothetical protein